MHGRLAAVFAQLIVGGESQGVHCLLVPIRDEDGRGRCEGVTIEDCGHKLGLNGVDNGRISFDSVRVPREALLNRYGDVTPEGEYTSPIENENRRFFTMLGTLIMGRVSVGGAALSATKTRADDRGPPRRTGASSSARRTARRSCCWTTARTSGGCCPRWRGRTRCTSPSSSWSPNCTASSPATRTSRRRAGAWRRGRRA